MSTADTPMTYIEVAAVKGPAFLVFRRQGRKIRKETRHAARAPRFRHPTFEAAQEEAARLARLYPESTFVIISEWATVKVVEFQGEGPMEGEQ